MRRVFGRFPGQPLAITYQMGLRPKAAGELLFTTFPR
jgi:hypothetical protein